MFLAKIQLEVVWSRGKSWFSNFLHHSDGNPGALFVFSFLFLSRWFCHLFCSVDLEYRGRLEFPLDLKEVIGYIDLSDSL